MTSKCYTMDFFKAVIGKGNKFDTCECDLEEEE